MVIKSAETVRVEKCVIVSVVYEGKEIDFSIKTQDDIVKGNHNNIATSYLSYFHDVPELTRINHFNQMKDFVEKLNQERNS